MLAPLCFALLVPTRRDAIHLGLGALASLASRPAVAFDNAVPEYADYRDKPKRPGTPPKDLGIAKRTVRGEDSFDEITFSGLRGCDGKPNCFSTTGDLSMGCLWPTSVSAYRPKIIGCSVLDRGKPASIASCKWSM